MSDYINREELLKHQYRIDDSASLSTRDVVNVEDIEDCPPADVRENIKGEWEEKYIEREGYCYFCSNCNLEVPEYSLSNFCPNCGAKMKGGE